MLLSLLIKHTTVLFVILIIHKQHTTITVRSVQLYGVHFNTKLQDNVNMIQEDCFRFLIINVSLF